jgi:hypothetical protein
LCRSSPGNGSRLGACIAYAITGMLIVEPFGDIAAVSFHDPQLAAHNNLNAPKYRHESPSATSP